MSAVGESLLPCPAARADDALSVEAATVVPQQSAWQRVRKSASVRIGGSFLALLVLVALLAPWLGTVDPSLFDPASRDLLPGRTGEITTLEGETLKHRFLMGSDSFGRDIYSRVIYGTQVSLIVGLATAALAMAAGIVLGLLAGYLRRLDGPLMRVMDGVMAIPGDPDRDRAGGDVARQPADRGGGDRDPRDPARDAAGPLAGADDPRGAVRRGGDLARHADLEDHAAPHPAEHAWRRWSCRAPSSAAPAS